MLHDDDKQNVRGILCIMTGEVEEIYKLSRTRMEQNRFSLGDAEMNETFFASLQKK
jgi:hypothetical protein